MIPVSRDEAMKRYAKVERETDEFGRVIGVRRLRPSQQTRVEEFTPLLEGNRMDEDGKGGVVAVPRRVPMVVAAAVCEIDGNPVPFPKTRADLDATLDLLDVEGLTAANLAYMRLLMGESLPSDTGEASKN
jgi:hypothetical protein